MEPISQLRHRIQHRDFYEIERDMHASSYNAIRINMTLVSTFVVGPVFYDEIEPTHVIGLFFDYTRQ